MSFTALGLSKHFQHALEAQGYKTPYAIQAQAIPVILKGEDVLGIAQTGSGKTASYVLPLLSSLKFSRTKNRLVNGLVLVPTRELAQQVLDVFHSFESSLPQRVQVQAVYGGVSINPQMKNLFGVNILVATPGRLLELVQAKALELGEVQSLVLDEADKMLNMGFKEELNQILDLLPAKRQNLLFSATLSTDLQSITQVVLRKPKVIKIEIEDANFVDQIKQTGYFVPAEKKGPLLRYIIKENDFKQVLIFTSSYYQADNVADKLRKNGVQASASHSKKSMHARKEALRKFKEGTLRVLVATDLLSRGIDIEFLPCVVNYDLPRSPKDFIHRIGRTGRAEATGEAIVLVTPEDKAHFRVIQKKMGKWVTMIDSENISLKGF